MRNRRSRRLRRPSRASPRSGHASRLARRGDQYRPRPCRPQPARDETSTSGSYFRTSSHSILLDSRPASASSSAPPANATISGIQWPDAKMGSYHSTQKTRGTPIPVTSSATRIRFHREATSRSAWAATPAGLPDRNYVVQDAPSPRFERDDLAVVRQVRDCLQGLRSETSRRRTGPV